MTTAAQYKGLAKKPAGKVRHTESLNMDMGMADGGWGSKRFAKSQIKQNSGATIGKFPTGHNSSEVYHVRKIWADS